MVATAAGAPHTYEEDPFIFATPRGFHMLTRRSVQASSHGARPLDDSAAAPAAAGCPAACELPGGHCFSPCPDAAGGELGCQIQGGVRE